MKTSKIIMIMCALMLCMGIASANTVTVKGDYISIYNDKGVFVKFVKYTGIRDVAVSNNIMYVATAKLVKIISIADPKNPTGLNNMKPAQNCMEIKGNYLYMGGEKGITVMDISVPAKPRVVKNIGTSKPVTGLEISKNILAVVTSTEKRLYDISKPGNPRFIVPGC